MHETKARPWIEEALRTLVRLEGAMEGRSRRAARQAALGRAISTRCGSDRESSSDSSVVEVDYLQTGAPAPETEPAGMRCSSGDELLTGDLSLG